VILYGSETWSLTLREEHKLSVFKKSMLSRIFGPKRDEVTGDCRKLHNQDHLNLYSLTNIISIIKSRRIRWAEHVVWQPLVNMAMSLQVP
jgi:hypothetical protein